MDEMSRPDPPPLPLGDCSMIESQPLASPFAQTGQRQNHEAQQRGKQPFLPLQPTLVCYDRDHVFFQS